jgi:photosystem II stability/assembly factor-like uncharacterized protein
MLIGDGDLYDKKSWEQVTHYHMGINFQGNIHGMDVEGDTIVVVGGKIPSVQGGFILKSEDAGETWNDITPKNMGTLGRLWKVKIWPSGDLFVAGEQDGIYLYN